jgi:hypothetical protein
MPSRIDPDKQAVYDAEGSVFEDTLFDELVTDADINELADELFGSDWWQQNEIPVPELRLRRLEASASVANTYHPSSGRRPEIRFIYEQVNPWTLAHEAAHVAQHHLYRYPVTPMESHGPEFRRVYLTVTEILCGCRAAQDLAAAFTLHVNPRPLTASVWTLSIPDAEGIFPRWRLRKQLEQMKRHQPVSELSRINGAIAL